ncbi:MAG: DUF1153 domain-containing protein [Parerythrobacter sp.]
MSQKHTTLSTRAAHPADAYARHETIAQRIKRAGLPDSYNIHWSPKRKADVVAAVHDERVSFDEVRYHYLLSRSEFETWQAQNEFAGERSACRTPAPGRKEKVSG